MADPTPSQLAQILSDYNALVAANNADIAAQALIATDTAAVSAAQATLATDSTNAATTAAAVAAAVAQLETDVAGLSTAQVVLHIAKGTKVGGPVPFPWPHVNPFPYQPTPYYPNPYNPLPYQPTVIPPMPITAPPAPCTRWWWNGSQWLPTT